VTEPTAADVERRVEELLAVCPPAVVDMTTFLGAQFDAGLAWVHYPEGRGGMGAPIALQEVVDRRLRDANAPSGRMLNTTAYGQGAATILAYGSDDQQERYLRRIFTCEDIWCQLFSEPGSGSDLAGLSTRAALDGEEWVVNGQKVWTSGAMTADRGMLLARVDMDAPKHQGLGYFIIPVQQPGIEVRPLKQMTGNATFNEVFFTDARVAHADLIGRPGDGWAAAVTTLAYERGGRAGAMGVATAGGGSRGAMLERKLSDVLSDPDGPAAGRVLVAGYGLAPGTSPIELARELGQQDNPVMRQELARHFSLSRLANFNQERVRAEAAAGRSPGPISSTTKLFRSGQVRANRDLGPRVLGPGGMLAGDDAPQGGAVTRATLQAPSASIAGGTDEIQHNIIGERVLGLPREPDVDREVPFRELKVGTQR
jgi:alkylation response protein AidB-like acyl-CoA dehydrogenase